MKYQNEPIFIDKIALRVTVCNLVAVLSRRLDDVINWKHFPRYWPFVRGIHRYPMISPHRGQWRGALMCSLICVWINGWVNNREAGDLRHYRAHYDVTVMGTLVNQLIHVTIQNPTRYRFAFILISILAKYHTHCLHTLWNYNSNKKYNHTNRKCQNHVYIKWEYWSTM